MARKLPLIQVSEVSPDFVNSPVEKCVSLLSRLFRNTPVVGIRPNGRLTVRSRSETSRRMSCKIERGKNSETHVPRRSFPGRRSDRCARGVDGQPQDNPRDLRRTRS